MLHKFKDRDQDFLDWKEVHPTGFVVNTYRNPQASYLVLHRADCGHFKSPTKLNWTKDYIKICAIEQEELLRWAEENVSGFHGLRRCKSCKP
jgi:hypothetical protein